MLNSIRLQGIAIGQNSYEILQSEFLKYNENGIVTQRLEFGVDSVFVCFRIIWA